MNYPSAISKANGGGYELFLLNLFAVDPELVLA